MIGFEHTEVMGWEAAIRGMRNPHNSWDKSDSKYLRQEDGHIIASRYEVGPNDHDLMMRLVKAGTDHRKFMRMIVVYVDVTAPLYLWKEFKTYRAGKRWGDEEPDAFFIPSDYLEYDIEMNSCSTMHTLDKRDLELEDFSMDSIKENDVAVQLFCDVIERINALRRWYKEGGEKSYWREMIQLLPSSYNQRRTLMLNYEVLANIYRARRNHKLTEWREFCRWIETLPYSELITGGAE